MDVSSKPLLIVAGIALLGAAIGVMALRGGKPAPAQIPPSESASTETNESQPQPTTRPLPSPMPDLPKPIPSANPREEVALMVRLRELGPIAHPELSLKLAREGDEKFPGSPDAAERSWFAVRALMEMRRIDDAVAESRLMVEKYRGTSFANDVEKHMLTHPMTHPSEVGYVEPD
jgi:hypothetical protein